LLCTLVIFPILLHLIWNLPCIITNGMTRSNLTLDQAFVFQLDQRPCCNPAIIENAVIITGLIAVLILVGIFILRCYVGQSCYHARSEQRLYTDASVLNVVSYIFFISALIVYSVEETFIICKGWDSYIIKTTFFYLFFLGILCFVISNICFLSLFVEKSAEESLQISD
jgi:hypothetical protein